MIRLYDRFEQNFNHNKHILDPRSCFVLEEANGMFELEIEVAKSVPLGKGDVITAPTPRGEQPFRIYRTVNTLQGKKAYARHIFYDLAKNFIITASGNNVSCNTALTNVLNQAETDHEFTASSDIGELESYLFARVNPITAIMGADGIINKWGGNLVRNKNNIQIKAAGLDRGYDIRVGKNLIGIEDDGDESNVKTRLYPTVVLGDSDAVISLPEKYVDSPLVDNYGDPIIAEVRIELSDEQKSLPVEQIYTIMRNHCADLYSVHNVDKPIINYKINFVELSKTEQYKHLAILEQLDLYDIVGCHIAELDIHVKAKVIKYKYDAVKNKYESIELGGFKSISNYQTDEIVKQIRDRIKAAESAIDYATNVITGNKGGYLTTRRYPNGKPFELLIMDTEDINTAQNVFRLNNSGLGFSRNGYNGPFGTAMTIDGHIVADFIDTGTLTAILLQSLNYLEDTNGITQQGSKINLSDGTIKTKHFTVDENGRVRITDAIIDITTSGQETSVITFRFGNNTMTLTPSSLGFRNSTTGKSVSIMNITTEPYIAFGDSTGTTVQFSTQGIYMPTKNMSCNQVSVNDINGGNPITTNNKDNYTYPSKSHDHVIEDISELNARLITIESRLDALES